MHSQGLERARVVIEGKGQNEPIASNADENGRQQNRRVEIFVRPPAG
jgi:outer membrane protein OmpA-like peptidoglycan-associated protein